MVLNESYQGRTIFLHVFVIVWFLVLASLCKHRLGPPPRSSGVRRGLGRDEGARSRVGGGVASALWQHVTLAWPLARCCYEQKGGLGADAAKKPNEKN